MNAFLENKKLHADIKQGISAFIMVIDSRIRDELGRRKSLAVWMQAEALYRFRGTGSHHATSCSLESYDLLMKKKENDYLAGRVSINDPYRFTTWVLTLPGCNSSSNAEVDISDLDES